MLPANHIVLESIERDLLRRDVFETTMRKAVALVALCRRRRPTRIAAEKRYGVGWRR
jgi:hypothetical protein